MRKAWLYITALSQLLWGLSVSASALPPSLQITSNIHLLSNGSYHFIKCLPKSNVTYPIIDSPLELAMTFGHRPILQWQVFRFLEYVLIDIKSNAAHHPTEYIPDGYYYHHEPRQFGAILVVPTLFKRFTWSDLYLVLHGLAEYVSTARSGYELCAEINFKAGGLAGVIFFDWWTSDLPQMSKSLGGREAGDHHLIKPISERNTG